MDIAQFISGAAAFVFIASLKGSVVVLAVLLLQRVARKYLTAGMRYLLWVPAVIALITPLGIDLPVPAGQLNASLAPMMPTVQHIAVGEQGQRGPSPAMDRPAAPVNSAYPVTEAATDAVPVESTGLSLRALLDLAACLWLAGLATMLVMITLASRRLAALIHRAQPAPDALQLLLRDCLAHCGCRFRVELRQSADVDVPMIARVFRPVLLLPAHMERQLTPMQLRHVFLHELMHVQRGDLVGNWVLTLVQGLHWFNPLVWFAFFRMRQDRELACDAATLRHLAPDERGAYGHTLLQLSDTLPYTGVPAVALGMLHGRSPLHRRILMLADSPQPSAWHGIAAVLLALPLTALAFSQPTPAGHDTDVAALAAVNQMKITSPAAEVPHAALEPESIVIAPDDEPDDEPDEESDEEQARANMPAHSEAAPVMTSGARIVAEVVERASPLPTLVVTEPGADLQDTISAPVLDEQLATAASPLAEAPPPTVTGPYAGLADIEWLATTLTAMRDDKLRFIERWNAMGLQCDARKDAFLGVLSASCQRIRTAQRRGEILRFTYECFQLDALHRQQTADYRAAGTRHAAAEHALQANASALQEICSKETYAKTYPAFAAIVADAEALKYFSPRRTDSTGALVATMDADMWRNGRMSTASSMFYTGGGNVQGPVEPAWSPAAAGSAAPGGFTGGMDAAPMASQ